MPEVDTELIVTKYVNGGNEAPGEFHNRDFIRPYRGDMDCVGFGTELVKTVELLSINFI